MQRLMTISMLGLAFTLTACGPSPHGIENRNAARDRLSAINSRLVYDQSEQAFEAGQLEKSLTYIDEAISRYPSDPSYHLLRGRILLETHRLQSAMGAFSEAIELDATFASPHYFAGIIYQRWSDDQNAYESYRTASDLDETNVQFLLAAAESLIALDDLPAARTLVQDKLDFHEHNSAMRHLLAEISRMENDHAGAARLLAEARLLNPDDSVLLEELAWAQFDSHEFVRAFDSVKQLQAELGHEARERHDLTLLEARCLAFMARHTEARNLYLKLSNDLSLEPDVWVELGLIAWEVGDYRRVAQAGVRAIALAPERFEGHMLRGLHARERGEIATAIEAFNAAATRSPNVAAPHLLLAQTLEDASRFDEARVAYEGAIQAEPTNQQADVLYRTFEQRRSHRATAVTEHH